MENEYLEMLSDYAVMLRKEAHRQPDNDEGDYRHRRLIKKAQRAEAYVARNNSDFSCSL